MGLVLVVPEEANKFRDSLNVRYYNEQAPDNAYYGDGFNDGKRFNMSKKLNEEYQKKMRA